MSEVQLVNETDQDIVLSEGSGGIYRSLKTIRKGKKYLLKDNPIETYREFQCKLRSRSSQKCEVVVLRPFVFRECAQVTIKWDQATDTLSYETKKRESGSNAAADKPSEQASPGLVQRLIHKLRASPPVSSVTLNV